MARALGQYEDSRKPNSDAIADMALDNFIEMRDHTASRWFLIKKKLSHAMHRVFPRTFIPLYNMVSFSTVPYAQARDRARTQSGCCASLPPAAWRFLRCCSSL
jgi:kynurenine 3-monooxygenase